MSYCQAAAFLEVVHAAAGLVRGSPANALVQWAGKSHVLLLALARVPRLQVLPATGLLLLAWALSEVVRYPWTALVSIDYDIPLLTWLRYSLFVPLYPVGVACEMWALLGAIPIAQATGINSFPLPNALNLSFSWPAFLKAGLLAYVPIWWQLYSALLRTRARKLPGLLAGPAGAGGRKRGKPAKRD